MRGRMRRAVRLCIVAVRRGLFARATSRFADSRRASAFAARVRVARTSAWPHHRRSFLPTGTASRAGPAMRVVTDDRV